MTLAVHILAEVSFGLLLASTLALIDDTLRTNAPAIRRALLGDY